MENVVRLPRTPTRQRPRITRVAQTHKAKVLPMTPYERLFIAGMTALSKAIIPLQTLCNEAEPAIRVRYERILFCLLKAMPITPRLATADTTTNISRMSAEGVCEKSFAQLSRSPQDKALHMHLKRIWSVLDDPEERTFAQKCAIALTEALHVHTKHERRRRYV